jgi:hypothetical protein
MAEAEPGRRVHHRGSQNGHAKCPEQGLHEVCIRMTRQCTEKQAGRSFRSVCARTCPLWDLVSSTCSLSSPAPSPRLRLGPASRLPPSATSRQA